MKKIIFALSSTLTTLLFSSTLASEINNSSLVVYNSNIGVVHEERALELKPSDTSITYEGVASSIETDSVNVILPQGVQLYSQQYRFDKLTQNKLLDTHIEKEVQVRLPSKENSATTISAILLANNGQTALVQTKEKKILAVASSDIIFTTIPDELITKPSLVWNIKCDKNIQSNLKLDYLINNISFKSDYILNIDENSGSLSGWITVDNRSGKKFTQTKLSLLAGDINRVQNTPIAYKQARAMAVMDSMPEVAHRALEGYHFYTIPFKVTLANNEKTQLKFLQKENFAIHREYSVMLLNPLYINGEVKGDVSQFITLEGFDIPLPKGIVRSYSQIDKQSILIGENALEHTPKNTPIKLNIGKNFDVKVVQKLLTRNDTKTKYKVEIEYTISNNSQNNKTIELLIPFNKNRDSKVDSKQNYRFTKGNLVTFSTLVQSNSTKSFKVNFESKK